VLDHASLYIDTDEAATDTHDLARFHRVIARSRPEFEDRLSFLQIEVLQRFSCRHEDGTQRVQQIIRAIGRERFRPAALHGVLAYELDGKVAGHDAGDDPGDAKCAAHGS
jgi:hypothetical protein